MEDCIFCKIAAGSIPAVKIWEDENHIAILDRNPNVKGMTLLMTKKHFDSYAFDMPDQEYAQLMKAAKKVAALLDKGLKVKRTAMVMEGLGVNHIHIKLYPLSGLDQKFNETWAEDRVFFDKYEGYISTKLGPERNNDELKAVADEIKKNSA